MTSVLVKMQSTNVGMLDTAVTRVQQLMSELSAIDMDGLWLTEFGIEEGRINLHGKAIKGHLIPKWMARFEGKPVLKNSRFSVVDLSQDEQDNQTFSLASERGSDE